MNVLLGSIPRIISSNGHFSLNNYLFVSVIVSSFYCAFFLLLRLPLFLCCSIFQYASFYFSFLSCNREKCDVTLPWKQNFWISTIFPHLHCQSRANVFVQSAIIRRKVTVPPVSIFRFFSLPHLICRTTVC